jgi:predicted 3-demethylubiquinone-9 3-methyltransferase (glyoxalase superfamily)
MCCRSRPQYRSDLGWILGVAFLGTLTRSARPVRGFTFVRCCSSPTGFFPTRPRGVARAWASLDADPRVQSPLACGCYQLAPQRTFTSYPSAHAWHTKAAGVPAGTAMVVEFELAGQKFSAINGGPHFKFSPAVSFLVSCETQDEVDYFWDKLGEGGDEKARQCGWLADQYGLSWQIVPTALSRLMTSGTPAQREAVMQALLKMKKIDIEALQRAFDQSRDSSISG